jgi:hypothetical protein
MAGASTEGSGEGDLPDNVLFDLYEEYLGEPDAETDVYLGFGLFFVGVVLGVVGLGLFFWSGLYQARSPGYFARAEPAYAMGMLSLPVTMVGVVVLLPVERRALSAAGVGTAVTVAAVAAFVWAYPMAWNSTGGADYTVPIVAAYALGLAGVVASTGSALVAHQIERAKPPSFEEVERHRDDAAEETGESWSDAEIEADIEEAMAGTDLNWGGVERSDNRDLTLDMGGAEEIDTSGMDMEVERVRSTGVDDQVAGLTQMKAGEEKTATGTGVDDQTAALSELREKKRRGETPDPGADDGFLGRVRSMFD